MSAREGRARGVVRLSAVLAAVGLSLTLSPAYAADGSIDHVQSDKDSIRVLYSLPDTGSDRPDLGSLAVSLDGVPADAAAVLASDNNRIRRTTVLAIDVSKSMVDNGKFTAAKRAAQLYLRSIPDNVYVGVVTFAGSVKVAQAPTRDRASTARVVRSLRMSLGTHLYDGVSKAIDILGTGGQRSVLVLSDGRDTSRTPLGVVTARLKATKTKVDVVALAQQPREKRLIRPLSVAGAGSVISADDPKQLSQVFSRQARILSNELLVTVKPPSDRSVTEGTLAVAVSAGGTTYTDQAFVTIQRPTPPAPKPAGTKLVPAAEGPQLTATMMLAGLVALAVGMVVLVLGLFGGLGKKEPSLESRISAFTSAGGARRPPPSAPQGMTAQAVDMAGKALASNRGAEAKLGARLDAAGMSIKPAEWLLLHAGIAVGSALLVLMLTGEDLLLTVLALAGGIVLPWIFLGVKKNRRLKSFNAQLAPTLQLMAASLQAGLSLAQGMDTIVKEGADPVAGEFRRALVETRLGVQVEDALDSMAERMMSEDFRWTVMAIRIQREVGGNLAELMLNVAATLRERDYLRRQVKSLSAEGRFSAYILLAMPPAVLLYEMVANRTYLEPLISTPIGWVMLAVMGLLMGLGAFMMNRMIKLEV